MTAAQLLQALTDPGVLASMEDGELVLEGDVPPKLEAYLKVIHTGIVAAITGKRWYATARSGLPLGPHPTWGANQGPLAYGAISPSQLLPRETYLLTVEGLGIPWHRLTPWDILDCPELFEPETHSTVPKKAKKGTDGKPNTLYTTH